MTASGTIRITTTTISAARFIASQFCRLDARLRGLSQDTRKPGPDGVCHGLEVRFQAMVTRHLHDGAMLGHGWHPEWVSLPLHDEHRDGHRIELVQAARRASAAGRSQWEREAKHGEGTSHIGSAAGDPSSQRSAADEKRQAAQLPGEQVVDRSRPSSVELSRRRGAPAACNTVGLLDERDAHPFRSHNVGHRHQVCRSHASPSPVAEDQCGSRFSRGMHVGSCQTVRRFKLERGHPVMVAASRPGLLQSLPGAARHARS